VAPPPSRTSSPAPAASRRSRTSCASSHWRTCRPSRASADPPSRRPTRGRGRAGRQRSPSPRRSAASSGARAPAPRGACAGRSASVLAPPRRARPPRSRGSAQHHLILVEGPSSFSERRTTEYPPWRLVAPGPLPDQRTTSCSERGAVAAVAPSDAFSIPSMVLPTTLTLLPMARQSAMSTD